MDALEEHILPSRGHNSLGYPRNVIEFTELYYPNFVWNLLPVWNAKNNVKYDVYTHSIMNIMYSLCM